MALVLCAELSWLRLIIWEASGSTQDCRETLANELRERGCVDRLKQTVRNEHYTDENEAIDKVWRVYLDLQYLGKILKKRSVLYHITTHSWQREWVDAASMQWCLFVLMKSWRPVCRVISNFGIWGPPSQPRVFFSAQTRWSIIYLCFQNTLLKGLKVCILKRWDTANNLEAIQRYKSIIIARWLCVIWQATLHNSTWWQLVVKMEHWPSGICVTLATLSPSLLPTVVQVRNVCQLSIHNDIKDTL